MSEFSVAGLSSVLNQLLPEPHAGLLSALLFGTKSTLPRDLYDAFVTSGTIHIAALSGQNLSIVSRLISDTIMPAIGKRNASLLTLFLIVWFVWFVGPSPTIVRAAIMGSLSILAVLFGRQYWGILSWMLAVGIMLLLNTPWLTDISFQLSALATLGIILFGGKEKHWLKNDLHLTLAAQSLTVPLIFLYFQRISLISPFSNLAIGWLIGPLTGLGWVTVIVGWIVLPLGRVLAWFDWVALEYLVRTVQLASSIPFASIGR